MTIATTSPHAVAFGLFAALMTFTQSSVLAQTAKYDDSYTIQGFSQPYRISAVASAATGIVQTMCVREGQVVQRGDCLLKLDHSVHDAKIELARVAMNSVGELDTAKAELAANQTRLTRIRELASRQHATNVELLQAEELVAVANANVQRALDRLAQQKADYTRLQAESKHYCIVAPFDGVVIEFAKHEGEYVGPGEATVCTIADLNTLIVEYLVPGHYRHNLTLDAKVNVIFAMSSETVPGTIQYISPYPNGETNTYTVKVRVANTDGKLNAGERCRLEGLNQPPSISAATKPHARDHRSDVSEVASRD